MVTRKNLGTSSLLDEDPLCSSVIICTIVYLSSRRRFDWFSELFLICKIACFLGISLSSMIYSCFVDPEFGKDQYFPYEANQYIRQV